MQKTTPQNPAPAPAPNANIAWVERDTGIPKDTLRMWERRYGFPAPTRDANGERIYLEVDVEKLRLIKRLIDAGLRPGKLAVLSAIELRQLIQRSSKGAAVSAVSSDDAAAIASFLALVQTHQIDEFRSKLAQYIAKNGLLQSVKSLIAPLTFAIGEAWRSGDLQIFEEHLFTESLNSVLRAAIHALPRQALRPRVLLTTVSQEPHGLGLLMAETVLAVEGCPTISLGVQTPSWDIVQAVLRQKANVVALSFSSAISRQHVMEGLRVLRHQLPSNIEIWAGGGNAALSKRLAEGVIVCQSLDDLSLEVKRWCALHGG